MKSYVLRIADKRKNIVPTAIHELTMAHDSVHGACKGSKCLEKFRVALLPEKSQFFTSLL